ncbi:hypothetical protein, partial [Lacticaseibacillus sharpeae]|uniref:hypothetical protein n=1 Tax=Lacticaseibacillus sharpeae TaxID=1626 RepID=UPI0012E258C3
MTQGNMDADPIPGTIFSNIIAGSLTASTNAGNSKTLITNGGVLTGTGSITNGISDTLSSFSFSDGLFSDKMKALKAAVTTLATSYSTDTDANTVAGGWSGETTLDNSNVLAFDFATAKKNAAGQYVFNVNTDAAGIKGKRATYVFLNQDKYTGGDVVINLVGNANFDISGSGFGSKEGFITGNLILTNTNGIGINVTDDDAANKVILLTPRSEITSSTANISGFAGGLNGDGSGDGYVGSSTPATPTKTTNDGGLDPSNAGNGTTTTTTPKTVTVHKTATVNQTVTSKYADRTDNTADVPEDPSKLPADQKRTVTVTYDETTNTDRSKTIGNVDVAKDLSGNTTQFATTDSLPAITPVKIDGFTTNPDEVANTALDENTLITKLQEADANGTINLQATIIYYPSSTSAHRTMTFVHYIDYDLADGSDGDESLLPDDVENEILVNYVEITDSVGNKTKTNFTVVSDIPDVQVPEIDGYSSTVDMSNGLTADAIVAQLTSTNGTMNFANTDVEYKLTAKTKTQSDGGTSVTPDKYYDYTGVDHTPGQLDDGIHVHSKIQSDGAISVTPDDFYDYTGVDHTPGETDNGVEVATRADGGASVTPEDSYDYTNVDHTPGQLDTGITVKERVRHDGGTSVTPDDFYDYTNVDHTPGQLDTGISVKGQVRHDGGVSVTPDDYYDHAVKGQLDDGIQVKTKVQSVGGVSVSKDDYYDHTVKGQLDD